MRRVTALIPWRALSCCALMAAGGGAAWASCSNGGSGNVYTCSASTTLSRASGSGTNVAYGSSTLDASSLPSGSTISAVQVIMTLTDPSPNDLSLLLVAPSSNNQNAGNILFMGQTGSFTQVTGIGINFADGGNTSLQGGSGNQTNGVTYAPSVNPTLLDTPLAFTSGAPSTINYGPQFGSASFSSQFTGLNPVGTWTLYGNEQQVESGSGTITWSLKITINAAATSTSTSVSHSINPVFTSAPNNSTTLTATVSATPTVNKGAVEFLDNTVAISGCSSVAVNNGTATCPYSPTVEGTHHIEASYTDSSNTFDPSNGFTYVQADNQTTNPTTGTYCNTGTITLPSENTSGANQANVYPSHIYIPSTASISSVTLTLSSLTSSDAGTYDLILVAPDGSHALIPMNNIDGSNGEGTTTVSGAAVTISDSATSSFPNGGTLSSGTYKALTITPNGSWPASQSSSGPPSVTSSNFAPNIGTATFLGTFGGVTAGSTTTDTSPWSLFASSGLGNGSTSTIGGWCLNVVTSGNAATTTTVSSNNNPSFTGTSVTFTATVTSGGPVTTGTVTFSVDGSVVQSGSALNGSGQATYTTSSLAEGTHTIQAAYSGVQGSFNVSTGSISQEVDHPTVISNGGLTFCNPGGIAVPNISNSSTPYPSRIFVSGLAGTLKTVTLNLDGFTSPSPEHTDALVVGPQATSENLVFMSQIGGSNSGENPVNNINLTFADSAGGQAPNIGVLSSGSYQPSSYQFEAFSFPSPAPSSLTYAASKGAGTFASQFASTLPNGTWSLYSVNDEADSGTGSFSQWCVNFTVNPPVMSISKSHTGSFTQGDTADTYTITVTNNGPGSTAGTMTLADTLPTGLSVVSMSETAHSGGGTGSDWSCTGASCTRTSSMASGESDTITLTVSVGYNAAVGTNSVTNSVQVSGGGISQTQTATDPTTINAGAGFTLSTAVSPSGAGTVTPSPTNSTGLATGHYTPGAVVNLTANPTSNSTNGYTFSSWSGSSDLSSTSANPTTITMNSDESVTANFTLQYTNESSSVKVTSSGLAYNRIGKRGSETMTVTNTGSSTISGPIQLVLSGLPGTVIPQNNTGTFLTNPYWMVSAGSIAPGGSAQVTVTYGYPIGTNFTTTPTVYSGTLP